jgi:ferredoxin-nitrite reductase
MSSSITNSAEFSTEQKEYLQGFFAGVAGRGVTLPFVGHTADGLITADPKSQTINQAETEPTWFDTPVSELSREELWKYEQNPLDIWDKILEYSNQDRFPNDEDRFRLKYLGLFHVAPAQDSFMLRLRMPGGVLNAHQMRGLARIAEQYGLGRADLTTRSNMQLRGFAPRHIVSVLQEIQALGLTSKGTGADNIRNITASPISGLDPLELIDVSPLAQAMQSYITNTRVMYDLPRKFNIAFDNGGAISTLADTNDIGFLAVRVPEGRSIPAGIYFRVMLCGITGHRQFASDCGLLLRPEETVAVAAAMIRVFVQHGDRSNRKKARLKYLIDQWGVERLTARLISARINSLSLVCTMSESPCPLDSCAPIRCGPSQASPNALAQDNCGSRYGRTLSFPTSRSRILKALSRPSTKLASVRLREQSLAARLHVPEIRAVDLLHPTQNRMR